MSQFKIYGHSSFLDRNTAVISEAIHRAAVDALRLPESKRYHRFMPLGDGYFFTPEDRSNKYLIIECVLFTGRTVGTKKLFYQRLLQELEIAVGVSSS
jgi:hypothetical protein